MDAALDDAEQLLFPRRRNGGVFHGFEAAVGPAMRAFHRGAGFVFPRRVRGALVEGHDDICAEFLLDADGFLWGEAVRRAVEMRFERDPILVDVHETAVIAAFHFQREDLVAARIGQDGAVPFLEAVGVAHRRDGVFAGAQMEVIGVIQNDLGVERLHVLGVQSLHGRGRADRHEDRRLDVAVFGMDDAGARAGGFVLVDE